MIQDKRVPSWNITRSIGKVELTWKGARGLGVGERGTHPHCRGAEMEQPCPSLMDGA